MVHWLFELCDGVVMVRLFVRQVDVWLACGCAIVQEGDRPARIMMHAGCVQHAHLHPPPRRFRPLRPAEVSALFRRLGVAVRN